MIAHSRFFIWKLYTIKNFCGFFYYCYLFGYLFISFMPPMSIPAIKKTASHSTRLRRSSPSPTHMFLRAISHSVVWMIIRARSSPRYGKHKRSMPHWICLVSLLWNRLQQRLGGLYDSYASFLLPLPCICFSLKCGRSSSSSLTSTLLWFGLDALVSISVSVSSRSNARILFRPIDSV